MGRYVRTLLRELAQRSAVALTLFVRDPHDAAVYRSLAGNGIEVAPPAAARSGRYDAIWYPWNGIRFAARAPAVVTINDDFAFRFPARDIIGRWREQQPIRRAVARAARIVTISEWSKRELIARFAIDSKRIDLLPLVPDAYFTPGTEASPYTEPFVLAVGAGEARKNIVFLLDAFARAFPAGDVRLAIVGAPPAAVAERLRSNGAVSLVPHVDDALLRRLYRTAAVVAVPSLAEGFGLVAAEAQACGAAVIAANTSALPEAVDAAGMLLEPQNARAWSDALQLLVRDEKLLARYRALARGRWAGASGETTVEALLAAFKLAVDNGA